MKSVNFFAGNRENIEGTHTLSIYLNSIIATSMDIAQVGESDYFQPSGDLDVFMLCTFSGERSMP